MAKHTHLPRLLGHSLGSLLALGLLAGASPQAIAKARVQAVSDNNRISTDIVKDSTVTLKSDTVFSEVRVANADIADITVLTDRSFHVTGKERGKTSVMIYDTQRRLVDIVDVNVNFDIQGLKKSLFESFPKEEVEVRNMAGKIYLSGNVSTARIAEQAEKIAQAYGGEYVTNGISIRDSHQVMLEVRFVEASRSAIKELGIGLLTQQAGSFSFQSGVGIASGSPAGTAFLSDTFGLTSVDVRIDALEEKGILRTLAEPNLVSMSGEKASFLAGGEYPIPVRSDGDVTIAYRQFGVGLSFTPTVLDDGLINLKVAPEVSQLDPTNSVRVGDVEVPALNVRRANTTVELRNDQSFAIAGLLQNTQSDAGTSVPWLGDVPVLGALFRSSRYRNQETELVIIVTPRLVQPVSDMSQLSTPLDHLSAPSELDLFLNGKIEGPKSGSTPIAANRRVKTSAAGGLSASYGHVIE